MIDQKTSPRFEFLDGLRGIAALAVVFFHFNGTLKDHNFYLMPQWMDSFFEFGHYGVQIFFVLSGFVIAYSLRKEFVTPPFIFRFFIRRSLRLDPPYWAVVALMLMLSFLGSVTFNKGKELLTTPTEVLLNLLYLPDFFQIPRILPVAWTLCIEIQFYLFFVSLLMLYQYLTARFPHYRLLFFHLIFSSVMVTGVLQNTSWGLLPGVPGLFIPYWYSFFLGCLVCWRMLGQVSTSLLRMNFILIGSYALWQISIDASVVLLIALTIHVVAKEGWMHQVLNSSFIQYCGKISYTLYLIHWPVGMKCMDLGLRFYGNLIDSPSSAALLLIGSGAVTFFAAHIFYVAIESPSLRFSKWVGSRQTYSKAV